MYAATDKEMRDSLQPSSMELGQKDASQAEQTNVERETANLKMNVAARIEVATSKLPKPTTGGNE
jgi:hypothetical protein